MKIEFHRGGLSPINQTTVAEGFKAHAEEQAAPQYEKEQVNWTVVDAKDRAVAVLAADILWDWMYIDELWVSPDHRGTGLGRQLVQLAEALAREDGLQGIWLWTQSWQAESFYARLGYTEFTRFDNFPKGYSRIGFRKVLF